VAGLRSQGHDVVALGRDRSRLEAVAKTGAETVALDLATASTDELAAAFAGCDGIVFVAGSTDPRAVGAVDRDGSVRAVAAAEQAGVRRFVQISSIGAGDRIPAEIDTPEFAPYYVAKRAADANLRESQLQWTIIEPGWLVDASPTGLITLGDRDVPMGEICRADVAATLIAVLGDDRTVGRQWQVVGGRTPIVQAIEELVRSSE
jgi:uncharacterized protein YbjT (DUF2867 family)